MSESKWALKGATRPTKRKWASSVKACYYFLVKMYYTMRLLIETAEGSIHILLGVCWFNIKLIVVEESRDESRNAHQRDKH